MHHADCASCCQIGRCHFCRASAPLAAHFEKDGQRFEVRLCPTHFSWAASNKYAPSIEFAEAYQAEFTDEPLRKSESFQIAVLAAVSRPA